MTSLELTSSGTAEFNEGEVYFIGNATTLIRFGGLTILTDPASLHKGEHVYLGHGIWARHEVEPDAGAANRETWRVDKMGWRSKTDRSAVVYNGKVTVAGIPATADDYMLGCR